MSTLYRFLVGVVAGATLCLGAASMDAADAETFIEVDGLELGELVAVGFELPRDVTLRVDAVGVRPRGSRDLSAYAWILDSDTREPVWVMDRRNTRRVEDNRLLRQVAEELDLEAGRYELYAYASPRWRTSGRFFWNGGEWRNWFGDGHSYSWSERGSRSVRRALDECFVKISADDLSKADVAQFEPTGDIAGALMQYNRLGDGEYIRAGFRLHEAMDLDIYALIELPEDWDHGADHGWIIDARTQERVWYMTHRNTEHAGGADKNRLFRNTVRLDAGEYVLIYGTDDSHSYEQFNASPPFDPLNWGITLSAANPSDAGKFEVIEVPQRAKPLVDLTGVRDYDFVEQPFRLKRDAEVVIHAVGEYSERDREFVDYGWIQKAGSSEIVWEMTRRNTLHAGGANKNRMFDGRVELTAGEYIAFYVTDDSHSYRRWNADAPFDPEGWGMAIFAGPEMSEGDLELIAQSDLEQNPDILVAITRVGDDRMLSERFTLDQPARVRVYALGEGVDRRMYDYGYIENVDTREIVWEMTWRNSRHAGGARKNRVYDGELLLEAGTYEVSYETDDSHSFQDWNARRPHDPQNWGITVSLADR